jgi:hypothetical protein
LRRVLAPFSRLALALAVVVVASAQVNPPVPAPSGPVNPPGNVVTPLPSASPAGSPSALPAASPQATTTSSPAGAPSATPSPLPTFTPTPPPIYTDPYQVNVEPQRRAATRIQSALGAITAVAADPTIVNVFVDQEQRVLYVDGLRLGTTTVTLTDARGVTHAVPVRVAYAAGTPADEATVRITGNPASPEFIRDAVTSAATRAAQLRPGAQVNVIGVTVSPRGDLPQDDVGEGSVALTITGSGYLNASGTTRVHVVNDALPRINPVRLLVSDYPERLTADGVLFTAHLDTKTPQRFLYYHYNPGTEPPRRILLKAHNGSNAPATVQMIDGSAGPGANEMEIGHLSTQRFLVREARNEGTIVTIAPGQTMNVIDHPLPPQSVVNGVLQLRLVNGAPLDLTLVAQHLDAPLDQSIAQTQLLSGGAPHARGIYPVPTFYIERTYDVAGADLEIPIGQLPLPNLRQGEALGGDYGVEQSVTVVIVNQTRGPRAVALYANPRGGRATGTFLIDGTLVQAHALPAFSKFKLWQETINAGTFRRIHIVTMPEGGSSYPLRLIFAPDDGSAPPFAPGSPIY